MAHLNEPKMMVYIFVAYFVFACIGLLITYFLNQSYINKLKEARSIKELPWSIRRFFKKCDFTEEKALQKKRKILSNLKILKFIVYLNFIVLLLLLIPINMDISNSADNMTIIKYWLDFILGIALVLVFFITFYRKILLSYYATLSDNASRLLDSEKSRGDGKT